MKCFIISSPKQVSNEIEIINNLLENHPVTFHLRKPEFSLTQMSDFLNKIHDSLHPKITIHSHHQLINDYNLKGIHFTQRNKTNISNFLDYSGSKSISTHSLAEIEGYDHYFDYYFLSPIFQSVSKPGYGGNCFDFNNLSTFIKKNKSKRLVALGGVTPKNAHITRELGFYGIAILGTFWQYCNNLNNINIFIKSINFHKIDG